jgi:hypothetical protein
MLGLLVVVAFIGCGSTSSNPPAQTGGPSTLLNASDLSEYPRGSVKLAFFDYWSSLQYRSWADAAAYYDPHFRDFVGTANIIGAKKANSSAYPLLKPEISRVASRSGSTTINYTLLTPEGITELDSMTWRDRGGNWQIIYDSRLDAELGQDASRRAEIEKTGVPPTGGSTPESPEAARAGEDAEELQARFLQEELQTSAP